MNIDHLFPIFEYKRFVKKTDKIIKYGIILLGLSLFALFLNDLAYPAYLSTKVDLSGNSTIVENARFFIAGQYYPSNDTIIMYVSNDSPQYQEVLIHETCHRNQHLQNRSYTSFAGKYLNELECYIRGEFAW